MTKRTPKAQPKEKLKTSAEVREMSDAAWAQWLKGPKQTKQPRK